MKTWSAIEKAVERHGTCAMVTILEVKGSAPRERGTRMLVTPEGTHGTIGGGALEWQAIAAVQKQTQGATRKTYTLGPDLGQCCGGVVTVVTETFNRPSLPQIRDLATRERQECFTLEGRCPLITFPETFGEDRTRLYLLGAGHVGRALVLPLATLPFDVVWLDLRPDSFPEIAPENIRITPSRDPTSQLATSPPGAIALVMSHSHALDLAFTEVALRNPSIAHAGLIGSATKRARFLSRLRAAGVTESQLTRLTCPIGVQGIANKDPASIAISTAAQLLQWREQMSSATVLPEHSLDSRRQTP
jgi:xanthine dehydrogenase accessory factor